MADTIDLLPDLNSLCGAAKKRSRERNRIAHALWAENGEFPDGIILLPYADDFFYRDQSVMLYRISDFVEIEQRLSQLYQEVDEFVGRIERRRSSTGAGSSG